MGMRGAVDVRRRSERQSSLVAVRKSRGTASWRQSVTEEVLELRETHCAGHSGV